VAGKLATVQENDDVTDVQHFQSSPDG
jgi:hypothetical protein